MSSLAEIQEEIEKLASEDCARLRKWFDAQDALPRSLVMNWLLRLLACPFTLIGVVWCDVVETLDG